MKLFGECAITRSRTRWLAGVVLFMFFTSCATRGVSTRGTSQHALGDLPSPIASIAVKVVDVTGVRVLAERPGETSIAVIADGPLDDYASCVMQTPLALVIDLSHARNAISQPVVLPPGSRVLRVTTMQLQPLPDPVLRLTFDLNQLVPYRVEVTPNGLQILAGSEISEQAPVAQGTERLEQAADTSRSAASATPMAKKPGMNHVKPADAESLRVAPSPPQRSAASAATRRAGREAAGESGQTASVLPSAGAKQPITTAPAAPTTAGNKRLSLDFKGADLDDLLRLISEVSGLNVVVAHGLKDRKDRDVTARLHNVEWRQALDVILRAKGLSYEQDGNLIYVGSKGEIQKSKEKRVEEMADVAQKHWKLEEAKRKAEDERKRVEEEERRYAEEAPCVRVIRVAYMKASDMKKHLERLKTRRGSIDLEETTNTLIISDAESVCLKMTTLAKELDTPPKDPFATRLLPFNYAKAGDLKTHLTALKTSQGSVIVDERSSRIIIKDLPEAVERMEALLKQIDIQTPQVLIEARIVEATRQFSQSLGIQWGGTGVPTKAGSTTGVTAFGGSSPSGTSSSSGGSSSSSGGSGGLPLRFPGLVPPIGNPFPSTGGGVPYLGPVPLAVNLPVTSPHFALGMTIGSLANRFLVGAQLSAAETQGKIRTLSSPRVATQDNEEAEIKQGTQVPYTTIDSSGRTVVQFQDAFIKLKVKPHITPDGRVSMKVEAERSFPGQRVDFSQGFVFPINTRKATTNIMVQNGSTVVIGGLLQSTETIATDQVPVFGDIPVLGWLFKRRSIGPDERVELLIFLTPSVLEESRL
ncbi:Type IV pilus biogenesis and competence protein PilQ precursor [Candidatus Methylomirabilis lanthanidiphila]|uniref:Type IV pilus biogenesis and competence protein PilQ n=1 Tax=Candidatus Methylomirabilis lanthanidiphila TaxID=2211376 RepID=A0A564ZGY3_9BACT|nr:Type IV pilus biogenesis and competence protein PilQ precursor [Candidatus Methylomirabilis lanthanidiphila]